MPTNLNLNRQSLKHTNIYSFVLQLPILLTYLSRMIRLVTSITSADHFKVTEIINFYSYLKSRLVSSSYLN